MHNFSVFSRKENRQTEGFIPPLDGYSFISDEKASYYLGGLTLTGRQAFLFYLVSRQIA